MYTAYRAVVEHKTHAEFQTMIHLSPQAMAEACATKLWESDHASQSLGLYLSIVEPGKCCLSMTIKKSMCNGHGSCHGGYIFTLADSAFAFACNTYNQRAVAQHCNITYVNPAANGDELTATATEVSKQGRSGIYDVRIENQHGEIIAEFRGHSRTIKGTLLT